MNDTIASLDVSKDNVRIIDLDTIIHVDRDKGSIKRLDIAINEICAEDFSSNDVVEEDLSECVNILRQEETLNCSFGEGIKGVVGWGYSNIKE